VPDDDILFDNWTLLSNRGSGLMSAVTVRRPEMPVTHIGRNITILYYVTRRPLMCVGNTDTDDKRRTRHHQIGSQYSYVRTRTIATVVGT